MVERSVCSSVFDHSKAYSSYFMTLNNYDWDDIDKIQELRSVGTIKYLVMCTDSAPLTGTLHLHAVFVL
jgi:hypothetical protein